MSKKFIFAAAVAAFAFGSAVKAQTNLQVFYDFGKDRGHVTTTIEGFYPDSWGNTFFFVTMTSTTSMTAKSFLPTELTWRLPAV